MELTRHATPSGPRWARDGRYLPAHFTLRLLTELSAAEANTLLAALPTAELATDPLLAPIEPDMEVWAAGVTYLRSRDARMAEARVKTIYDLVYEAERPELFFKSLGWRVAGPQAPIHVRKDSNWNVPEPELAVYFCADGSLLGYTVGDDVSSRDIEGENPLYLPQAKIYNGAAALGPAIRIVTAERLTTLGVTMAITRGATVVFQGETETALMKRTPDDLVRWLLKELQFPTGGVLMTGTGIVPPDDFSLLPGDRVRIAIDGLVLENPVV